MPEEYLLGDKAAEINGQVFQVQGYDVARMGMVSFPQRMTNVGPWDVDTIAARLPEELGPDFSLLPVPWPEPKG